MPLIPVAIPLINVSTASVVSACAVSVALDALEELIPASCIQAEISSPADEIVDEISDDWEVIPPMTMRVMSTASARKERTTIAAAPVRPTWWRPSQCTTGCVTQASRKATTTGPVISAVAPRSQMRPASTRNAPAHSQDATPRSRSQRGAAKTPESCAS